jgi:hypothetical protein
METAFNFIEHAKHHGHILVHCHKGVSRSASFVIGYLMKKNEMTFEEALSHVQSVRPMIQPNDSFMEQLRRYEVVLNEQRQSEQMKQNSYNQKMSRGSNSEGAGDERDYKRIRMEVSVGPMLPPSADVQLPSMEPQLPQIDIDPPSHPEEVGARDFAPLVSSTGRSESDTSPCAGERSNDLCDNEPVTTQDSLETTSGERSFN